MSQQVPSYSPKKLDFTNFQILEAPSMSTAPLACSLCFQFRNSLLGRTGSYEYRRDVCFVKDGFVGKLSGRGKTRKPSEAQTLPFGNSVPGNICVCIFHERNYEDSLVCCFRARLPDRSLVLVAFLHELVM